MDRVETIREDGSAAPGRLLFVFIDGVGIGEPDPRVNPLSRFEPRVLKPFRGYGSSLPRGGVFLRSDPGMEVAGLPQSATGQSALFTGINTARALGRHLSGFPTAALRDIIAAHSLLRRLKSAGRKVAFANTYTTEYLERLYPGFTGGSTDGFFQESGYSGPGRKSVTTVMNESAGLEFRTEVDLVAQNGLHMDFTNRFLRSMGADVPLRSPRDAADILASLAERFDLCVYEFFFSDLVGHRGDISEAAELLEELDEFLFEIVSRLDFGNSSLIVTSDHGNIEDMSTRQHTFNLVPLLLWGGIHAEFAGMPDPVPITWIAPAIIRHLAG